jgi:hypothetical protein
MTTDELLAAGFRAFDRHSALGSWDRLYQKKVEDQCGTRYFINVYHWTHQRSPVPLPPALEAEVCYNDGIAANPSRATVKVQAFSVADWSVGGVIRWAEELWERLAPNYYERTR